jgi:hypothetical protein
VCLVLEDRSTPFVSVRPFASVVLNCYSPSGGPTLGAPPKVVLFPCDSVRRSVDSVANGQPQQNHPCVKDEGDREALMAADYGIFAPAAACTAPSALSLSIGAVVAERFFTSACALSASRSLPSFLAAMKMP